MKHGKGIISFENGYTYEGDFVNDKKHGKGIINLNIKGILFKIKDMEKELLSILVGNYIKESLRMDLLKAKELWFFLMEENTKDHLKTISLTVREYLHLNIKNILEHLKMVENI